MARERLNDGSSVHALIHASTTLKHQQRRLKDRKTMISKPETLTSKPSLLIVHRIILYFKSAVLHEMQYEYLEVLQDIKILKENHVLLRDNFRTPS
jgi:hypothetical protein